METINLIEYGEYTIKYTVQVGDDGTCYSPDLGGYAKPSDVPMALFNKVIRCDWGYLVFLPNTRGASSKRFYELEEAESFLREFEEECDDK